MVRQIITDRLGQADQDRQVSINRKKTGKDRQIRIDRQG